MKRPYRIAITTGDADGIGMEIAAKALAKVKPRSDFQFFLWRSTKAQKRDLSKLDSAFKRTTVSSWHEALKIIPSSPKEIVDINSALSPATWVETSAQAAMSGYLDGIVTAPISKGVIAEAGMKDIGHTDILKRISGVKDVYMGFIGKKFSVILATGHIPISQVAESLTAARLEKAVLAGIKLRTLLNKKSQKLPIGVLGLNPHAGEDGIIADDEDKLHKPLIEKFKKSKQPVEGPLVPDVSFFEHNYSKYSVLISNYHDQGLIPFKSLNGREANVHVSLGLPFVRTSVDHGTAKDIFGKNKADPDSMIRALELAMSLCREGSSLELNLGVKNA